MDERSYCFPQFKTLHLTLLLQLVYPDLYCIDTLTDEGAIKEEDDNGAKIIIPQPTRLQLSFEKISATGIIFFSTYFKNSNLYAYLNFPALF